MRQFNVEFFDRTLTFVHRDSVYDPTIDDDYISAVSNNVEISSTDKIENGHFVYITSEDIKFFGIVTDVAPGEDITTVTYKPFISLFDEEFLMDCYDQGTGDASHPKLEDALYSYMRKMYVTTSDTHKRLNLEIVNAVSEAKKTSNWSFYILPDVEGSHYSIVNLYTTIIVNALKMYGVVVSVQPIFSSKKIVLTINKIDSTFNIDGNLDNVNVKTLKYNERPTGTNKLVVYNNQYYSDDPIIFYVHPDRSWDIEDTNRITPVVTKVSSVSPSTEGGFAGAAVDLAYSTLSGAEWDNLIELETIANDPIIRPMDLETGQLVSIWYKGGKYSSILTGRGFEGDHVTLYFGSERIKYSKRKYKIGG